MADAFGEVAQAWRGALPQRLGVRRVESWRSHTEPLAEDDLHGGSNMAQLVCRRPLTEVEKPKVPPEKLDNQLEGLSKATSVQDVQKSK